MNIAEEDWDDDLFEQFEEAQKDALNNVNNNNDNDNNKRKKSDDFTFDDDEAKDEEEKKKKNRPSSRRRQIDFQKVLRIRFFQSWSRGYRRSCSSWKRRVRFLEHGKWEIFGVSTVSARVG